MDAMNTTLKIRTYKDRVVVDFGEEETSDFFAVLEESGLTICLGSERLSLSWPETIELRDVIGTAARVWAKPTS